MAGLYDLEYHEKKIKEYQPPLAKLNKVIQWDMFRTPIEEALYVEPKGAGGRSAFDKVMMFKILILQKYYNLSDEQTEFQINDRTSFKQFLELKIGDTRPDQKTIWHFKEQLANKNAAQKLFELFTGQLPSKGVIAKEGSMIDAKWMTKSAERHYGYKDHINADAKTKLITKYSVSSVAPHDSTEVENIIDNTDKRLHADSAYRSKDIEKFLKEQNCERFVHEKGYRGKPLTEEQKESNNTKSKIRARIEHIFGFMTNSMHDALHMRSIGIKRITSSIGFLNLTYNLFGYEQLVRLQKVKVM